MAGCSSSGSSKAAASSQPPSPAAAGSADANSPSPPTGPPSTSASLALPSTSNSKTLLTLTGKGDRTTQKFTVQGPWSLDYAYDCSNAPNATNFQIFPTNTDPNVLVNAVNEITKTGMGGQSYTTPGSFYLLVNTQCHWSLRVSANG